MNEAKKKKTKILNYATCFFNGQKQKQKQNNVLLGQNAKKSYKIQKDEREPAPKGGGWEYVTIRVKRKTMNPELCKI